MATVTINGQTFRGNSISIRNGTVVIDGAVQSSGLSGVVEVRVVEGVLGRLETDASATCGSVQGDVAAGGSVRCDGIGGSVQAGGSVNCGDIAGSVMAGGSVRRA